MFAEAPVQIPREAALAALKPLLESDAVLKVGQNIKYDLTVLARHGIAVAPIDDTMVMSFCLDAGRGETGVAGHGMDELASRHLGHTTMLFKDVCGTGKKQISFAEVPLADATRYAAEDAEVTWRLHQLLPRACPTRAARASTSGSTARWCRWWRRWNATASASIARCWPGFRALSPPRSPGWKR
jgi:DNA polymerase-1